LKYLGEAGFGVERPVVDSAILCYRGTLGTRDVVIPSRAERSHEPK
jgi:hypothetical protein